MLLEIITPDEKIYSGEVSAIKVPSVNGSFEVLENHTAIVSALSEGELRITEKDGQKQFVTIDSGVIEVLNNKVIVLAESAKKR